MLDVSPLGVILASSLDLLPSVPLGFTDKVHHTYYQLKARIWGKSIPGREVLTSPSLACLKFA